MKLLIVSHTPHYLREGSIVGWGPTVREIDHLTQIFDEVVHIAPLHSGPSSRGDIAYQSLLVQVRPVSPAGGRRFRDKVAILTKLPVYVWTIFRELRTADAVHVRCPANISLIAIVLLGLMRAPRIRWMKYAGNWRPKGQEPWSYRLQRWWLNSGLQQGVVTVNGQWADQPAHVRSFLNPSLTEQDVTEGDSAASGKQLSAPLRLIYVGGLERAKGVVQALNILSRLQQRGLSATLDLVGDGSERRELENLSNTLRVAARTTFHGWLARSALYPLYAQAHLIVLPSKSEGWPKVLSEAMAYGVVPIASNVSSIPQYLERFGTGRTFEPDDVEGFTDAISYYSSHPSEWKEESERGVRAAELFTYEHYLNSVQKLLDVHSSGKFAKALSNPIF